ncbi:PaaI family thioesterase [Methyloversatilis sp.]|uniref:PaaI family thioesterase n=1 Tax=Methyloversatilis sp. TaxID=2569862 RepID=UPI003D2C4035
MPPSTVDDCSAAPESFTPRVLRGPFFGGRTVFTGGALTDLFAARITADDCNGLGITHGGVIATLADIFLIGFIAAQLPAQARLVTASLMVDYLGPSRAGDWLLGRTHAHRIGRRQCVAAGEFRVGERTVALIRASCALLADTRTPQ